MMRLLSSLVLICVITGSSCQKEAEIIKEIIKDTINFADTTALKKGLVAWYPFRGNANDASGNGLHGTLTGNAKLSIDERGIANGAAEFDGFGDAIVVAPSSKFNMNDSVTFAFKFMSRVDIQRQNFIGLENYNTGTSTVFQIGKSTISSPLVSGGFSIPGVYTCGNIPVASDLVGLPTSFDPIEGIWYHLALTYTKTSCKVFINGLKISEIATNGKVFPYCANANLIIGSWWNLNSGFSLDGKMDDVRIYNRLLTDKELFDLFKTSLYLRKQ